MLAGFPTRHRIYFFTLSESRTANRVIITGAFRLSPIRPTPALPRRSISHIVKDDPSPSWHMNAKSIPTFLAWIKMEFDLCVYYWLHTGLPEFG